ncbi:unnamed protein product [Lathyrus sativus]|nr:unnamed protein product [Lathyrus sativus]
MFLQLR